LRAAARDNLGVAAACILDAFADPDSERSTFDERASRFAGAVMIAEGLHHLEHIHKQLSQLNANLTR
jgi:hypothetical protein